MFIGSVFRRRERIEHKYVNSEYVAISSWLDVASGRLE